MEVPVDRLLAHRQSWRWRKRCRRSPSRPPPGGRARSDAVDRSHRRRSIQWRPTTLSTRSHDGSSVWMLGWIVAGSMAILVSFVRQCRSTGSWRPELASHDVIRVSSEPMQGIARPLLLGCPDQANAGLTGQIPLPNPSHNPSHNLGRTRWTAAYGVDEQPLRRRRSWTQTNSKDGRERSAKPWP